MHAHSIGGGTGQGLGTHRVEMERKVTEVLLLLAVCSRRTLCPERGRDSTTMILIMMPGGDYSSRPGTGTHHVTLSSSEEVHCLQ